jgi:hypothetical protein
MQLEEGMRKIERYSESMRELERRVHRDGAKERDAVNQLLFINGRSTQLIFPLQPCSKASLQDLLRSRNVETVSGTRVLACGLRWTT